MRPLERFLIVGMLLLSLLSWSINTFAVDFASLVSYPVGSAPTSVVVADFNGDGKLDLAVANSGSGTVSILLANESGSFQRAIDSDAGMAKPASLAVGDFNGDGKLDLVVFQLSPNAFGSLSPAAINILFGNGDGSFQAPKTTTLAVAIDLAVADFNLDRKADIAITDYDQASNSTTIFILLGNGDGSFQSPKQAGMFPGGSGLLAAADFNNDAKPDLAIGISSETRILLGHGDGTFQTVAAIPLTDGFVVQAIHAGDANGDGKLDLLVASLHFQGPPPGNNEGPTSRSDHISVLLGNGDGTLQAERVAASSTWSKATVFSPPVGDSIEQSFLGDFDADQKLDLALSRTTFSNLSRTRSLEIGPGKGDGTFLSAVSFPYGNPIGATADLNGDTLADFVFLDSNAVSIALNTTSTFQMTFAPTELPSMHPGESASLSIAIEALNGFSGNVALTCMPPASVGVNCSVSPTSVIPDSSATLNVSTTGSSAAIVQRGTMNSIYALCLPILGLTFASLSRMGRLSRCALLGLGSFLLIAVLFLHSGCGSGGGPRPGQPGTPAGLYTLTITGSSGPTQQSTTTTLTVQ